MTAGLLAACGTSDCEEPIDGASYSTHYIQDYIDVDRLSVSGGNQNYIALTGEGTAISGAALASYYKDTGYNSKIVPHSTKAISNPFTAIDLTSDRDFDERHPAGTSLADIVYLAGASPNDYIRSGYVSKPDWDDAPSVFGRYGFDWWYSSAKDTPIYLSLAEIGKYDLALLNPLFFLVFESQPASNSPHTMTLTITDDTGKNIVSVFDWPAKN